MEKHLREYLRYKKLCGLQPDSIRIYKHQLTRFKKSSKKLNIPDDENLVTGKHVIKYLKYYKKYTKSPFVWRNMSCALSNYFKFLCDRDYINNNPTCHASRKRLPQRIPPHLTFHESTELIKILNKNDDKFPLKWSRNKLFVCLLLFYGLRLREALNIRVKDINLKKKTILIRESIKQDKRVLPLIDPIFNILKTYIKLRGRKKSKKLIIRNKGAEYQYCYSNNYIRPIVKYAKLHKSVSSTTLRNTFLSLLCSAGINGRTIQAILGQHTLKSIERKSNKVRYSKNIMEYQ